MVAARHTPTPWLLKDSDRSTIIVRDPIVGYFAIGTTFAFAGNESPNGEENAAFIVRACNAHDSLLAALKGAIDLLSERTTPRGTIQGLLDVVAKAEGRS